METAEDKETYLLTRADERCPVYKGICIPVRTEEAPHSRLVFLLYYEKKYLEPSGFPQINLWLRGSKRQSDMRFRSEFNVDAFTERRVGAESCSVTTGSSLMIQHTI